ncbi:Trypsin-like cysteine/serine peptidase domain protein [Kalmanozyma brasiliensis GHG001]|uniref:Uncharacterized protein n=1 Tax=Kalmanozyma brasiliensis (strain GHG001) TaxID=1365824 RepID=V5EVH1_KALBG|nr:Trypsin-like cysteine/serine peptidase domain protein [Kalmanozyma brasiliensis GHG001]EST06209.1 Trypsin-like cysteine/serine peptidase domain protein [Kalmanozyma brasiliensis GHG001]
MLSRTARLRVLNRPSAASVTIIRSYAVPVNPSSSVDALLGTSVPPPPREGQEYGSPAGTYSTPPRFGAKNPNDISDLLRGHRPRDPTSGRSNNGSGSTSSRNASLADLQRIKGTAIGAERRGIPIPSRDEMLEEMFKRPMRELEDRRGVVDREHPHPIDALYGRNELDERVLAAARALHAASNHPRHADVKNTYKTATLSHLLERFESRSGYQLSIELPYEPTPADHRKVPLTSAHSSEAELQEANDDGVLLLAYVSNLTGARGTERISVSSGFAVEGGDKISVEDGDGKGPLVVTCAHTLRASLPSKGTTDGKTSSEGSNSSGERDSIALAITRTGAIYPVRNLISSLPTSDVILLQLGTMPLSLNGTTETTAPLRTLPVSPYPAHVNSELSVSSFWGWEDDSGAILPAYTVNPDGQSLDVSPTVSPAGRSKDAVKLERDDAGRSRWGRARLVEYKDPCGASAMVGTYDELAQLDYKLLVSSPANPPALQGDYALRLSSTVTEATRLGSGGEATERGREVVQSRTRKPLPNFPPPGSSGGPVVDVESGSVVGVVRGHKMSALEGRRGDAVPAEKVFEFFALPGLGRKN